MGEKVEGGEKKQKEGQSKGKGEGNGSVNTVLKFDMHCEGCAKKVKRSIKNFPGVESVKTEFSTGKLTVVGDVDPVKIKERVEEKIKKKVELLSLQPKKPLNKEGGEKKSKENKSEGKSDNKKSEDKKDKEKEKPKELSVATVVLKTRVHCDGCVQKIKKIVGKYDGVQGVNVDLQKDTITIKGTMNMKELLPYLNIKLKRNVELASAKKDENTSGDKKSKEGGGGGGGKVKDASGSSEKAKEGDEKKEHSGGSSGGAENVTKFEVNKMEYNPYGYGPYGYGAQAHIYDPRQHGGNYGHQVVEYWHAPEFSQPPQMFSDENPNACSVM